MNLNYTYNNTPIKVEMLDCTNPWFSANDICTVLGVKNVKSITKDIPEKRVVNFNGKTTTMLSKYGVIRLTTRRRRAKHNQAALDLFRKWFINEFRLWFEGGTAVTSKMDTVEEIDEENITNYIIDNCKRR